MLIFKELHIITQPSNDRTITATRVSRGNHMVKAALDLSPQLF